jgi:hypothetical protein
MNLPKGGRSEVKSGKGVKFKVLYSEFRFNPAIQLLDTFKEGMQNCGILSFFLFVSVLEGFSSCSLCSLHVLCIRLTVVTSQLLEKILLQIFFLLYNLHSSVPACVYSPLFADSDHRNAIYSLYSRGFPMK